MIVHNGLWIQPVFKHAQPYRAAVAELSDC